MSARTHCPYCALNCGLDLRVKKGEVVGLDRWAGAPLTGGALCAKGDTAWEQVNHAERLVRPLVRRGDDFEEVEWNAALDIAAEGFSRIRAERGAAANALLSGGSLINEKVYLLGKFARLALGTPHIDFNGRFSMSAAGTANMLAFGADRMMTPLDQLKEAEVVVVVGAHVSATFPVVLPTYLNYVRRTGGRVIIVDPRAGRFVKDSDIHVALEPGTDSIFFTGLLREIVRLGLVDMDFVEARTVGFAAALSAAMPYDPEFVELVADVPAQQLTHVAKLIGETKKCMILHGRGPDQHLDGTQNVLSMINVALACGHIGRPSAGINMLTGQRNGQGGREWGQGCDQLPAGRSITDPQHRAVVAERWGVPEDSIPGEGARYVEILTGAGDKTTRGLLAIGTNMATSSPDLGAARQQLDALDHHVVVDPFFSESATYADVVLPGTTFAEESGTVTTIEGRVVRVDQAIDPVAGMSDFEILAELADRLDAPVSFSYASSEAIFEEMRRVSAGGPVDYSGITYDRLRDEEGVFWPCPDVQHPGTPQLYLDSFSHADGKARFVPVVPRETGISIDAGFPLTLTTGRVLAQFASGNQTNRIEQLRTAAPGPYVEIHPETASAYGLARNAPVDITSDVGAVEVPWVGNRSLRHDTLFMPYHWPECNLLVSADVDPASGIPGFKLTPVRIEASSTLELDAAHADTVTSSDDLTSGDR